METKILSFRMPQGWAAQLDNAARKYGFACRGEMIRLVLIEATYNTLKGRLKIKKGRIETPTVIIGCRLPVATLKAIRQVCCEQVKDTSSVWCAMAIAKWYQDLQKEDSKQQRGNIRYSFFLQDYAKNYRDKVSVYNTELP